ncbi:21524_t:CDS:2, partial [Dentiscutata erythropus]
LYLAEIRFLSRSGPQGKTSLTLSIIATCREVITGYLPAITAKES